MKETKKQRALGATVKRLPEIQLADLRTMAREDEEELIVNGSAAADLEPLDVAAATNELADRPRRDLRSESLSQCPVHKRQPCALAFMQ